jgi:hypothetical protein
MRSLSSLLGLTDRRDTTSEKPKNQAIRKFDAINIFKPQKAHEAQNQSAKMVCAFCAFCGGFLVDCRQVPIGWKYEASCLHRDAWLPDECR